MKEEQVFNPGDVEPAKVNLIPIENNVNQEQLDTDTPATVEDKPAVAVVQPVAPAEPMQQQASNTQPVQALPQDSDVYKNLQAIFTKTSQENIELKNRLAQFEAELTQLQSTNQQQPAENVDFGDLDKVAEDFEELKPIASRMKEMQIEQNAQRAKLDAQSNNMRLTAEQQAQMAHENAIAQVHSDSSQIAQSVDFQGWMTRQPSYMQQLLRTGNSQEIIDLLTSYKSQREQTIPPPSQQQQAIDAARLAGAPTQQGPAPLLTTDSNKRHYTNAEIDAMSYSEYAACADDIEKAMEEGRVTV